MPLGARPCNGRATSRARGFSLVEVVVTMAVLTIGLALASRLVVESQLGLLRSQAELANPLPRYAMTRLRSDLEGATGVVASLPGWRSSQLVVVASDGARVVWQHTGEQLQRVPLDAGGAPLLRQVALREVASWRWRPAAPGLVDVEVVYRVRDTSAVPLLQARRTWSPPTVERTLWMRVAARASAP